MKTITLATGLALTSTSATTAVTLRDTPILPYRSATVEVEVAGATGTTTMLIEGSENGGTSYSTLATISIPAASPGIKTSIKAYPLVRVRNSVAGSAGTANVYLEAV
jgi:hypothetical protein